MIVKSDPWYITVSLRIMKIVTWLLMIAGMAITALAIPALPKESLPAMLKVVGLFVVMLYLYGMIAIE